MTAHTHQPDVAVIIPTHNRAVYLRAAIDSVMRQQFDGRIEIIVVDDGSVDNTAEVVRSYAEQHSNQRSVTRFLRQKNQGQAVARNAAIKTATAPFIAFLDDDDLFEPNKLQQQLDVMRTEPHVGLVHTSFRYIDSAGQFMHGAGSSPQRPDNPCTGWCADTLLNEMQVIFSTVMVRHDVLAEAAAAEPHGQPFDPELVRAQDYDLTLRIARLSQFAYIDTAQLRYRFHAGNNAMAPANLKHTFSYHCRVQIDFARRYGHELGVNEADARRRAAAFLLGRAQALFWQRQLMAAKQLCELAKDLDFFDDNFAKVEQKASRPAWLYKFKDGMDRLIGRG